MKIYDLVTYVEFVNRNKKITITVHKIQERPTLHELRKQNGRPEKLHN